MSTLWEGRRAPVTLLGGYLGSGKTTLLNELLASADRKYAVLVNDLGAVNVDAALVASRDGDTIELSDGCVCCSLSDGFALAFERLRERPEAPDHVIVELSGVADPGRVVPFSGTAGFVLDGVLVLFDLDQGLERLEDRWSGDTVQRQIAAADLLVLTKRDLVEAPAERAARDRLAVLAPGTPIALAQPGALPASWLSPLSDLTPASRGTPPLQDSLPGPSNPINPISPTGRQEDLDRHCVATFEIVGSPTREELESWLLALPDCVVRVKGVVSGPSGLLLVEGVGRRRRVRGAPQFLSDSGVVGSLVVIGTGDLAQTELPSPPGCSARGSH